MAEFSPDATYSQAEELGLSVQVVQLDYYMHTTARDARNAFVGSNDISDCNKNSDASSNCGDRFSGHQSPVIRIWGSTSEGRRATIHVHNVYPYMYFRPKHTRHDCLFNTRVNLEAALSGMRKKLHTEISGHRRSNIEQNKNGFGNDLEDLSECIHSMEIVEATNFYGYHPEKQLFVKLVYRAPSLVYLISSILQQGRLLEGVPLQPFEAHLPFILQFTSDYNIKPMDWVDIGPNFRPRYPAPPLHPLFPPPSPGNNAIVAKRLQQCLVFRGELGSIDCELDSSKNGEMGRNDAPDSFPSILTPKNSQTSKSNSSSLSPAISTLSSIDSNVSNMSQQSRRYSKSLNCIIIERTNNKTSIVYQSQTPPHSLSHSQNASEDPRDNASAQSSQSYYALSAASSLGYYYCNLKSPVHCTDSACGVDSLKNHDDIAAEKNLNASAPPEIDSFEGITFSQIFTQGVENKTYITSKISNCKSSTSEIEIDIDGSLILNRLYDFNPFGSELFDEEAHRREARGLPAFKSLDGAQEKFPRSLNVNQQLWKENVNETFRERLHSNNEKLRALIKKGHDLNIMRDVSPSILEDHNILLTLTQQSSERSVDIGLSDADEALSSSFKFQRIDEDSNSEDDLDDDEESLKQGEADALCANTTLGQQVEAASALKRSKSERRISMEIESILSTATENIKSNVNESGVNNYSNNKKSSMVSAFKPKTCRNLEGVTNTPLISQVQCRPPIDSFISLDSSSPSSLSSDVLDFQKPPLIDSQETKRMKIDLIGDVGSDTELNNLRKGQSGSLVSYFKVNCAALIIYPKYLSPPKRLSLCYLNCENNDYYSDGLDSIPLRRLIQNGSPSLTHIQKYLVPVLEAPCKAQIFIDTKDNKSVPSSRQWEKALARAETTLNSGVDRRSTQISNVVIGANSNSIFNKLGLQSPDKSQSKNKSLASDKNLSIKSFSSKKSFGHKHRITLLSVEVLVKTRAKADDPNGISRVYGEEIGMHPDPEIDSIEAIFWTVDDRVSSSEKETIRKMHGVILKKQSDNYNIHQVGQSHYDRDPTQDLMDNLFVLKSSELYNQTTCEIVESELDLFDAFFHVIGVIDPDIIVGFNMEKESLGYIIARGKYLSSPVDTILMLSRVPNCTFNKMDYNTNKMDGNDKFLDPECGFVIKGRILLNVWKRMRDELKLLSYTINNVADHVLGLKFPAYSFMQLSRWFAHKQTRRRSIEHLQHLCHISVLLLDKLDIVRKTSECARLFGIDFYSVLTRGSQYRVEAAILRHCKADKISNFVLVSPSKVDVSNQGAMKALPLVMEPRSGMYSDPVAVLDFQSLYPSLMIAYNLCFSTCFGALNTSENKDPITKGRLGFNEFSEENSALIAVRQLKVPDFDVSDIDLSSDTMPFVSSNGGLFVSKNTREGILPLLLRGCLECRMMIKSSMKLYKDEPVLQRLYDARQLAIKLLMNVTYGYTSASFSGRMPMSDLADAIVQTGRDMLFWTITEINSSVEMHCMCRENNSPLQFKRQNPSEVYCRSTSVCKCRDVWPGAKVVYGDTDSVFVRLPGRSLNEAHRIGSEIAAYITSRTPLSMLLKFEKVYRECVLVSKKRYVGFKFESSEQMTGELEAKGIEMVRRDQCPIVMVIQENALRLWFESKDLEKVRSYLEIQWTSILQGRLTIKDFIFRKEIKSGTYKNAPPGVWMVEEALKWDKNSMPPYGWRMPYVIVSARTRDVGILRERARHPLEYLRRGSGNKLDLTYYIEKCINPALSRVIFSSEDRGTINLINIWYNDMKKIRVYKRSIEYEEYSKSENVISKLNGKNNQQKITNFLQESCFICGDQLKGKGFGNLLCLPCEENKQGAFTILYQRWKMVVESEHKLRLICQYCGHRQQFHELNAAWQLVGRDMCESLDCSIFFERCKKVGELDMLSRLKL